MNERQQRSDRVPKKLREGLQRVDSSVVAGHLSGVIVGVLAIQIASSNEWLVYLVALVVVYLIISLCARFVRRHFKRVYVRADAPIPQEVSKQLRQLVDKLDGDIWQVAELLVTVFHCGMPPAFVKRWEKNGAAPQILENEALGFFRRPRQDRPPIKSERLDKIREDHRVGDQGAADDGEWRQIEIPAVGRHDPEPTVLTTKVDVMTPDGKKWIVGWFVPVQVADEMRREESIRVVEKNRQVLYKVVLEKRESEGYGVTIGKAVRTEPSRSPA